MLTVSQLGVSVSSLPLKLAENRQTELSPVIVTVTGQEAMVTKLIEEIGRQYGVQADLPIRIAHCESRLKQYSDNGEVLRGRKNPQDIGIFQINEKYHLEKSRELGFNIHTPEGNVGYALWLINHQGEEAWFWSEACWG